jgi:hypothetical protein
MKQKLKQINNKLDLNKKYPNYFNKLILRLFFGLGLLFCAVLLLIYGFTNWTYIECLNNPLGVCKNPFVYCKADSIIKPSECKFYNSVECVGVNCDKEVIKVGEIIGQKPPAIVNNSILIFILIITFGFGVNHLNYIWRVKK